MMVPVAQHDHSQDRRSRRIKKHLVSPGKTPLAARRLIRYAFQIFLGITHALFERFENFPRMFRLRESEGIRGNLE